MKITIENTAKKETEREYPYLGVAENGTIVWFVSPQIGISLNSKFYSKKDISGNWVETDFTPVTELIVKYEK